jgi:hypothetical protein
VALQFRPVTLQDDFGTVCDPTGLLCDPTG